MSPKSLLAALAVACCSTSALALPIVFNDSLADGRNAFDATVAATGSSVATVQLVSGVTTYTYGTNTVTLTTPGLGWDPNYCSNGICLSGAAAVINPSNNGTDAVPGSSSGITFSFSSPVNAFGFEIGDWATCCQYNTRPSSVVTTYGVPVDGTGLWIGFDGGALRLVANSTNPSGSDNPGVAKTNSFTNFIGSIDDTGLFSSVTFFGDGFGEYLVAGGTLRFASVPEGSVSVPEPTSIMLVGLGLAAISLRRRQAA